MLVLFFGAGSSRILLFGSSNTPSVEWEQSALLYYPDNNM